MNKTEYSSDFFTAWARGTALYVRWANKHGISYPELSILYALLTKEEMTQKAISEMFGLPKQTIHNVIRLLIQEERIKFKSNIYDKREKFVMLSEQGKKDAQFKLASLFEIEDYIARNISEENYAQAIETRELYNTLFEQKMET